MPKDRTGTRVLLDTLINSERLAKKDYEKRIRSIRESLEELDDVPHDLMLRLNKYTRTAQEIFNKIDEIKSNYG